MFRNLVIIIGVAAGMSYKIWASSSITTNFVLNDQNKLGHNYDSMPCDNLYCIGILEWCNQVQNGKSDWT